ncbi:arylsulfatase G [Petromyzon marinus]|uniref:arylsulfatase G n=1 Tax=Petromyzon marinus TaxID=7757 RepID=UPI003F6EB6D3
MGALLPLLLLVVVGSEGARPNFVLVVADDLGWGDVGWARAGREGRRGGGGGGGGGGERGGGGGGESETPSLDEMARDGMRLLDFHAGASCCSPSRAALLTGRLGARTGVTRNFAAAARGGLPLNETTLATALQDAGYSTALIGKWHLGHVGHYHPNHRGFRYYFGLPYSNDMGCTDHPGCDLPPCPHCPGAWGSTDHAGRNASGGGCADPVGVPLFENAEIVEQPARLETLARRYAERAEWFIRQHSAPGSPPFLLLLAPAHVHVPLPWAPGLRGPWTRALKELDETVGRVVRALRSTGLSNNTLVWFSSDNGPWDEKCDLAGSTGPYTGKWQCLRGGAAGKRTTWEGGHRVPGLALWPGRVPPGSSSSALLSALDVLPTLLPLARVPLPPGRRYDGADMRHVLLGQRDTGHTVLFHPNSGAGGEFGDLDTVRVGPHKVFFLTGGARPCGGPPPAPPVRHDPPLLFNVETDPGEGSPVGAAGPGFWGPVLRAQAALRARLEDIGSDRVSRADYGHEDDARPCCRTDLPACRCDPTPIVTVRQVVPPV